MDRIPLDWPGAGDSLSAPTAQFPAGQPEAARPNPVRQHSIRRFQGRGRQLDSSALRVIAPNTLTLSTTHRVSLTVEARMPNAIPCRFKALGFHAAVVGYPAGSDEGKVVMQHSASKAESSRRRHSVSESHHSPAPSFGSPLSLLTPFNDPLGQSQFQSHPSFCSDDSAISPLPWSRNVSLSQNSDFSPAAAHSPAPRTPRPPTRIPTEFNRTEVDKSLYYEDAGHLVWTQEVHVLRMQFVRWPHGCEDVMVEIALVGNDVHSNELTVLGFTSFPCSPVTKESKQRGRPAAFRRLAAASGSASKENAESPNTVPAVTKAKRALQPSFERCGESELEGPEAAAAKQGMPKQKKRRQTEPNIVLPLQTVGPQPPGPGHIGGALAFQELLSPLSVTSEPPLFLPPPRDVPNHSDRRLVSPAVTCQSVEFDEAAHSVNLSQSTHLSSSPSFSAGSPSHRLSFSSMAINSPRSDVSSLQWFSEQRGSPVPQPPPHLVSNEPYYSARPTAVPIVPRQYRVDTSVRYHAAAPTHTQTLSPVTFSAAPPQLILPPPDSPAAAIIVFPRAPMPVSVGGWSHFSPAPYHQTVVSEVLSPPQPAPGRHQPASPAVPYSPLHRSYSHSSLPAYSNLQAVDEDFVHPDQI